MRKKKRAGCILATALAAVYMLPGCNAIQGDAMNAKSDYQSVNEVKAPEPVSYEDYDSRWEVFI